MVPGRGDVQQAHQPQAVQGHVSDIGVLVLDAGEQLQGEMNGHTVSRGRRRGEAHTVSKHYRVWRSECTLARALVLTGYMYT